MAEDKAVELPDEIKALSFEQALKALEEIVHKLEAGQVELDESIEIYTRGTYLRHHCEAKLNEAAEKIEKITKKQDGSLSSETMQ